MPSQVKTGLTSWTFTAPLIPWFLFTIHTMKESKESWLTTKTSCRVTPENSVNSHSGSPITATATSVMSLCVLSTANNPVLGRHIFILTRLQLHGPSHFQRHQRLWLEMFFFHQEGVTLPNVWLTLLHLLSPLPCHLHRRNWAFIRE